MEVTIPSPSATYVARLSSSGLELHLYVLNSHLTCKEALTHTQVPILTRVQKVTSVERFQHFLQVSRVNFRPRYGLEIAGKGRGGGNCCERDKGESKQLQGNAIVKAKMFPQDLTVESKKCPQDPVSYALKKEMNHPNQARAVTLAEEILRLAAQGSVTGMGLSDLEDLPIVTIQAPLPVAQKLLQALHQEAIWTVPLNYMIRYSLARLARKFLMDHLFLGRTAYFASTNAETKLLLGEVMELAKHKDELWLESGTMAQLAVIDNLVHYANDTNEWWCSLVETASTIFDAYTMKNPVRIVPFAVRVFARVKSIIGHEHIVEAQMLIDNIYAAFKSSPDAALDAVKEMVVSSEGWEGKYAALACLEWAVLRRYVTTGQIERILKILRPYAMYATKANVENVLRNDWRICEKVASLLIFLSAQGVQPAQSLLSTMKTKQHDPRIQRLLDLSSSVVICVEPAVEQVTNVSEIHGFKGRNAEIAQANLLLAEKKLVTLVGPPGVGKSAMAQAVAVRQSSFAIIWQCDAESPASLFASLRALSDSLNLKPGNLSTLLHTLSATRTLLILDNYSGFDLSNFNDLRHSVHLIITSRNPTSSENPVRLDGLNINEAVDLVTNLTRRNTEKVDIMRLCGELNCIPLALKNISALIASTPKEPVKWHWDKLINSPNRKENIGIDVKMAEVLRMCIEKIRTNEAKVVLQIAALMTTNGVPGNLYSAVFSGIFTDTKLEKAITECKSYALISVENDGFLTMQSTIQMLVLEIYSDFEEVFEKIVEKTTDLFDSTNAAQENKVIYLCAEGLVGRIRKTERIMKKNELKLCIKVLEYQIKVLGMGETVSSQVFEYVKIVKSSRMQDAEICDLLGQLMLKMGLIEEAEALTSESVDLLEKTEGMQPLSLANSYDSLANVYSSQGKLTDATELLVRALSMKVNELGYSHKSVAESYHSLGVLYKDQGRLEDAITLIEQSLKISKERSPLEVAEIYHNLAVIYHKQGVYSSSVTLFQSCISLKTSSLPPSHPSIALTLTHLSRLYHDQGQYQPALQLVLKAISMQKTQLGPAHPDLASSYNVLAGVYYRLGRVKDAERLWVNSLRIRRSKIGVNCIEVAEVNLNLAELYSKEGRRKEAISLTNDSIDIYKQKLGETHPDLSLAYVTLAGLYHQQGHYSEALKHVGSALSIQEACLPGLHPAVATAKLLLGVIYREQGKESAAIQVIREAIEIREKTLGGTHPEVATAYNELATVFHSQGCLQEAARLHSQALHIQEASLTPSHPSISASYHHLAKVYSDQGNFAGAEELHMEGWRLEAEHTEPKHLRNVLACRMKALTCPNEEDDVKEEMKLWKKMEKRGSRRFSAQ